MPPLAVQPQTRLELLGPGGLKLSGAVQKLSTKKLLGILAYLALEGATPRAKLADLFWSDCTSSDARRNLRREIHRLRHGAFADLVQGETILVLQSPLPVDVLETVALFEAGELETALESSRSELLEGMFLPQAEGFTAWLECKRAWLQKRQVNALLELSERSETRGDWAGALVWQQQLLALEPLQERTHRQIMRLFYLLGQREDALRQFGQCQQLLKTELGLEPLPETVLLSERIRASQVLEPLEAHKSTATQAVYIPLVGRADVLHQIQSSGIRCCLLVGEAGMGKSRLLEALGENPCLRFTAALHPTPFAALAALIRQTLPHPEVALRLSALEPVWLQEAARLVPELFPQHTVKQAQPDERARFLEGLSQTIHAIGGESGLLLLDDLHHADTASLEWLGYVLGRPSNLRLVASTRPPDTQLEAWLNTLPNLERIELLPLPKNEVQTLLQPLAGDISAPLLQHLEASSAGNPFFLLETWRFLQASVYLEQQDGVWVAKQLPLPLPPTVRATVLERVLQLGMATRRLLETAALCGDRFTAETILPATALGEWEGMDALELALGAGLVQRAGTAYTLAHDLIRTALTEALLPERQRLIHRKLAGTLEQPMQIAWHLEQAGLPEQAVPWRIKAGQQALDVFAYQTAVEQYRLAAQHSPPQEAFRLYAAMLEWHQNLGQPQIWVQDLEQLETLAQTLSAAAQNEALLARAQYHIWHAEDALALECTKQLLARDDVSALHRITALEDYGYLLANLGQFEESNQARHRALAFSPETSRLRGKVYYGLMMNAYKLGQLSEALAWAGKARANFEDTQSLGFLTNLLIMEGVFLALLGQEEAAIASLEAARREAKRILHPYRWVAALFNLFELYFERGELPNARAVLLEVREAQPQFTDPFTEGAYWRCQSQIAWFDGETQTALEYATHALELDEQSEALEHLVLGRLTLAKIRRELGETEHAKALLLEVGKLLENSSMALHTQQYHLEQAALALDLGNADAALEWLGQPEPNGTTAQNAMVQVLLARAHWIKKDKRGAKKILAAVPATSSLDVNMQKLILQLEVMPSQVVLEQARQMLGRELPTLKLKMLQSYFNAQKTI